MIAADPMPNPAAGRTPAAPPASGEFSGRRAFWPLLAVAAATIPFAGLFTLQKVFHIRDLSLLFWPRHLWLRRSLYSGEWPLWDPYIGGGQSAVADGLHQMFLLPVLALRLLGSETVGFNLWVAMPYPVAALGTYLFFRSRFSAQAAALGAVVFAVSGPVVSSGNFPNLGWSIAALPWVLWAIDRCLSVSGGRSIVVLAFVFAFQVLAGEPVTMAATALLAVGYAGIVGSASVQAESAVRFRARGVLGVVAGLALGMSIAAVQVLPMVTAGIESWRPYARDTDFWSLHPLALVELVSKHLFGNYFDVTLLEELPWMRPLNSLRDPFFYSIYLGPAALCLAVFGALAGWRRAWSGFWVSAAVLALLAAFGSHTPFYPFLQAHVPLLKSFRFPVKYLVIVMMAASALTAAAWDALESDERRQAAPRRFLAAHIGAMVLVLLLGIGAYALSAATQYLATPTARRFYDLAIAIGATDPIGCASYMLRHLPPAATRLVVLCMGVVLTLLLITRARREQRVARHARWVLYALVVGDLVVSGWGLNPTLDAALLREPAWAANIRSHPETRLYFGGRGIHGSINDKDPDAPKSFVRPFGMTPIEGRSALSAQSVLFPSAWRIRELFSYDLSVLWPRPLMLVHSRFLESDGASRDRFLERTAGRYRVVQPAAAPGRTPLAQLDYFQTACLYDWGPGITRVFVVPDQVVVADLSKQIDALFSPGLDARRTVVTAIDAAVPAGVLQEPVQPTARIASESANQVVVEAGTGANGGFLVLLDTFSPDWTVTVDGRPGIIYRGNALFRVVRLVPGRHRVEFRYRPWAFQVGGALSIAGLLVAALLMRAGSSKKG